MAKRSTLKDVAQLAQVSTTTVSYVINDQRGGNIRISDETRARVMASVKKLGYQPNVSARTLRTQRTQLLAVMVPDLTNPFYPQLLRGMNKIAEQEDYQILIYDCEDRESRERAFIHNMLRRQVDGVALVPFHLEEADVTPLIEAGVGVVMLGERLHIPSADHVAPEEATAVKEAIRHLVGKGHTRIAHIAGPQDTPPGRIRLNAYRQALAEAALPCDESLIKYGTFQRAGTAELVESLFAGQSDLTKPTAIFAANDVVAIETMRTLIMMGLRVPEDVAVCGFDNIPEAEVVMPSLTTIDQNPQALGQNLAQLLLSRLNSAQKQQSRHISVPCKLVIREST
jgi:LacI family transcriptional regulator